MLIDIKGMWLSEVTLPFPFLPFSFLSSLSFGQSPSALTSELYHYSSLLFSPLAFSCLLLSSLLASSLAFSSIVCFVLSCNQLYFNLISTALSQQCHCHFDFALFTCFLAALTVSSWSYFPIMSLIATFSCSFASWAAILLRYLSVLPQRRWE